MSGQSRKSVQQNLFDISVHLFCGVNGWDHALALAGWPAGLPVWTGSCPCQPFSSSRQAQGSADERHLWPEMFRLVRESRPLYVLGEQVSGAGGYGWFAGVQADLEGEGYAVGAADLPACGVGTPPHPQPPLLGGCSAGRRRRRRKTGGRWSSTRRPGSGATRRGRG